MKIFANKNIWKKIVIIFLLISTLSFAAPKPVAAGIGGELMEPICDLLVGLGDGTIGIMHKLIIQQDTTLIRVDLSTTVMDVIRVIVTIAAFALAVAIIGAATAGVGIGIAAIAGTLATEGATAIATSAIIAHIVPILVGGIYFGASAYTADKWDNEVDLPMYSLTPEAIFTNNIPLFDVNFFNTDESEKKAVDYAWATALDVTDDIKNATYKEISADTLAKEYNITTSRIENNGTKDGNYYYYVTNEAIIRISLEVDPETGNSSSLTKVEVNTNENLIKNAKVTGKGKIYSFSKQLSKLVSNWYFGLRMLAIVGMMSVLVYIGIRILISSTSPQKAKYKELLGDWLVGMVLLFTMHYIMVVANIFTDNLSDLLSEVNPNKHAAIIEDKDDKIEKALTEADITVKSVKGKDEAIALAENQGEGEENNVVYKYEDSDGRKYIEWHTTLMGQMRLELMYNKNNDDKYIGYTIMFLVMIMYLIIFAWTYIKRVIYMAFLTLIAPLVALTYPIDKVNDGKAQGFNYWFKEYIFNLLLQPMHLLIYTILVSSAIELATTNWIYALVALGFIASAEKIVRQMFNFSKANTPGAFSGAAGAALAFSGMRYLLGHGPKGGKGGQKSTSKNLGGKDSDGNTMTSTGPKVDVGNQKFGGVLPEGEGTSNFEDGLSESAHGWLNYAEDPENFIESGRRTTFQMADDENSSSYTNPPSYTTPDISLPEENPPIDLDTGNARREIGGFTDDDIDRHIIVQAANGSRKYRRLNRQLGNGDLTDQQRDNIKRQLSLKRGMKNTMSYAKDQMKQNFKRTIANSDPINKLGRIAAAGALGATSGMLGIAAATVSGQPDNIWKMGGVAAALGGKTGMGIYDNASANAKIDGIDDVMARSVLGEEEYKKRMAEKAQKEKAEDEAVIRKIQEKKKINREEAKKWAKEWAKKCMDEKINDVSDWLDIEKMTKQELRTADGNTRKYSFDEAVSAYKIHKRSGFEGRDKEKAIKKIKSDWNLTDEQAKIYYKAAKVYDDIKNS